MQRWHGHNSFLHLSHRFFLRNAFPGFGLGVGAFAVYLAVDALTNPSNIEKLKEDAKKQKGEL